MQDLAGGGGEMYYERYKNGVLTGELDIGIYGPVICLLTQQMSQQKESVRAEEHMRLSINMCYNQWSSKCLKAELCILSLQ